MKRVKINAVIDMLAFAALLLSVFTGIIPWKVLPSGGGGPRAGQAAAHALFLGWERGVWRELHTYTSFAFAGLVIIHLLLHWPWIRCIPRFFAAGKPSACGPQVICPSGEPEEQPEASAESTKITQDD